jgi:hypothetical protein
MKLLKKIKRAINWDMFLIYLAALLFIVIMLLMVRNAEAREVKCKFLPPLERHTSFKVFKALRYKTIWYCEGIGILITTDKRIYEEAEEVMIMEVEERDGKTYIKGFGK